MLDVRGLVAGYGGRDVLHGLDLEMAAGEFICVIGANTAGKTTLLRAISRLVPRAGGVMRFAGRDLMRLSPHELPSLGIAHVPEGRQLFPDMSVAENLALGAFAARGSGDIGERMERVLTLFPRLRERHGQAAGTLSGGEQQMVAVGRALMVGPKLLMLDEPSHGLAPRVIEEMHAAFTAINRSGTTVLLVEQNVAMALDLATRGYVLESGRITLKGSTAELRESDAVRAAYLGM
ncbi:MAG: ABC transporter ATP-binding protein [Bradyrhizobiaceae bacterium]|nr:ABC transporter ATP-binding protein [Bradyrhizobiaceae bacterium]